jgi:hypothetical protein
MHDGPTTFRITARYGRKVQRYHTFQVEATGAVAALRMAADQIPEEIEPDVDLVELRVAPEPHEERSLL